MVLGVVTAMLGMIGSLAAWSVRESRDVTLRLAALEALANLMEEARITAYAKLDKTWAESRALPSPLMTQIPGSKLQVQVITEPGAVALKRVIASIEMRTANSATPHNLTLATLVAESSEAKP
jgi:hypothetical protein